MKGNYLKRLLHLHMHIVRPPNSTLFPGTYQECILLPYKVMTPPLEDFPRFQMQRSSKFWAPKSILVRSGHVVRPSRNPEGHRAHLIPW